MREFLARSVARSVVQVVGFVRKELLEVLRQPRLLVVLVLGPFLLLMVFAIGYNRDQSIPRTGFVGPQDSVYAEAVDTYSEELEGFLVPAGFTSDLVEAERRLRSGELDLVVQFPPGAAADVLAGDQAIINVFHDKLDPIQQSSVTIAAKLAVQALNAEILERALGEAGAGLDDPEQTTDALAAATSDLDAARRAGDVERVRAAAARLRTGADAVRRQSDTARSALEELGGEVEPAQRQALADIRETVTEIEQIAADLEQTQDADSLEVRRDAERLDALLGQLDRQRREVIDLEPQVLARPFRTDAENLLREPVRVDDFFAVSAVALLLQHLALTFAALGLVRDEALGLFETFRVGPTATRHVLAGKYLSYLIIGGGAAAALVASLHLGLGVPLRGSVGALSLAIALLLGSSIGLGLLLSTFARSDTQAVQFAMLALLAGLFFGGFFLDLELFRAPVRAVSWALPVTYGIRLLQDVMLRGDAPARSDLVGLLGTTVVFSTAAAAMLWRRLRIE